MDTLLPTGSLGISVDIAEDGSHRESAARLEELGYDALWVSGGQVDRLSRVDELLAATKRITVGTAILALGVHDDDAVAGLADRADDAHPGRLVLGLGGPQQARPMTALAGHLDALDATRVPGAAADRRILAALGPRKTEVARDRAAGAITLLTTPDATARTRAILGPDRRLVVQLLTVVGPTDAARAAAARQVGFLSGIGGYRRAWREMGFTEDQVDGADPRLLESVAALGDETAIARRVAEHRDAGADHVALLVVPAAGGPAPLEVAGRLAPVRG